MVKVDKKKCTGCGQCIDFCPANAIKLVDGKAVINKAKCAGCLACINICPNDAISE